ncbi:nucleoid occlusion protein [Limosilactobacillus fastidiosus]|uniref:Nucleoid occlusion protein n=1 Tax=Limosilactobacillus fastidiosus TaxID=2759855 RepID=A0A7W3TYG5_9LACO|nr:nucleoid occlusion protein [Limosilactobacillus fastidiosus]MBB1085614.1 nucleoid occlusion protein [Limosilactobacillus fastidiosus]MCD7086067.1 nucleoid occlusion protein [Limosilactobacillus fastidiosus]MCD7114289.1 nucleoid occlusion protein [Limosilactobacillus fastidiosus]MCD7116296.1 nucleoid occlusion protein [Limosilactobacillus fastidiosus]
MAFSLFGIGKDHSGDTKNKVVEIKVEQIIPNRYQPRKVFDQDGIRELAQTIDEHGLLQPIVVREYESAKYEIIAGERRYRAVKLLNWETVPAIVEKMSDKETASLALIENLQRSQLSSIEEAQAYRQLMDLNHLTQSALAKGMGKSQSFVANKLRLLKLIKPVQTAILDHRISERHGRAMLDLDEKQQREMLMRVVNERLTVRQTEDEVAKTLGRPLPSELAKQRAEKKRQELADLEGTPIEEIEGEESLKIPSQEKPKKKVKANKQHKKASTSKRSSKASDGRLALNTIKKSIKLATDNGFTITTHEKDNDDTYQLVIEIPKKQ